MEFKTKKEMIKYYKKQEPSDLEKRMVEIKYELSQCDHNNETFKKALNIELTVVEQNLKDRFLKKIAHFWEFATSTAGFILSLFFFIFGIILNTIPQDNHVSQYYIIFILVSLIIAIPIFLVPSLPELRKYLISDTIINNIHESSANNKDLAHSLTQNNNSLSDSLKKVTDDLIASNEIVNYLRQSSDKIRIIESRQFFTELDYARKNASKRVLLTSFSKKIYRSNSNKSNNDSLEKEINQCRESSYPCKKIITLHTKEKFETYKNVIENIKEPVAWKVAYLDINKIEDAKLPRIIGFQIIDDTVIIMDPLVACVTDPEKNNDYKIMVINNKDAADVFEKYYEKLWEQIESSSEPNIIDYKTPHKGHKGYILYDGDEYSASPEIWKTIEDRISKDTPIGPAESPAKSD
jgi:hypothetical protein